VNVPHMWAGAVRRRRALIANMYLGARYSRALYLRLLAFCWRRAAAGGANATHGAWRSAVRFDAWRNGARQRERGAVRRAAARDAAMAPT